jgi:hypothetical protein
MRSLIALSAVIKFTYTESARKIVNYVKIVYVNAKNRKKN